MPNKNPFLKSGKRKRKNKKKKENVATKPDDKPFCPRLMIRYDQSENSTIGYKVIWVCKMCMKCILHQDAVLPHLQLCKLQFKSETTYYEPIKSDEVQDSRYVCRVCDGVFSRKVTLLKHLEKHNNTSDSELYESESEYVAPTKCHKPIVSSTITSGDQNQIASTSSVDHNQIASTSSVDHNQKASTSSVDHNQKASTSSVDHNQIATTSVPKRKAKAIKSQPVSTEGHNHFESTSASSLDLNTLEVSEFNDETTVEH